jgi:hypothetical protein
MVEHAEALESKPEAQLNITRLFAEGLRPLVRSRDLDEL